MATPRTTTRMHTALGFLRPIDPEALIDDIIVKRDDSFLYGRLESALGQCRALEASRRPMRLGARRGDL